MKACAWWLVAALALGGCSSLLPEGKQRTVAPWKTFDEAKQAFDQIRVGETDLETVRRLGIDPDNTKNIEILNYSQVADRVLPGATSIDSPFVPIGVRICVQAQDRCFGYALSETRIQRKRVGGFLGDFLNFKRETLVTGWRFNALVVMVEGRAVFKQWSGQPDIEEVVNQRNPLGPLQDFGERVPKVP